MKVAILGGTSLLHSPVFDGWERKRVETAHGAAVFRRRGGLAVLNRHGEGAPLPPHAINHRANLAALAAEGYEEVVAFNSVGSLRQDLPPGTLISCEDYVGLQQGPATFYDDELKGGAPGLANTLLPRILERAAGEFDLEAGQIYVQMKGPRFETKAEIRIIREWGDVVGMTLAHEADLCVELGVSCTSLGMVDNYANGVGGSGIDFVTFKEQVRRNQAQVDRFLGRLVEWLGE